MVYAQLRHDVTLEEWKQGRGQVGQMQPKYQENADLSDKQAPRVPQLKLCQMNDSGHLTIPTQVRDKWLQDPVRSNLHQPLVLSMFLDDFFGSPCFPCDLLIVSSPLMFCFPFVTSTHHPFVPLRP